MLRRKSMNAKKNKLRSSTAEEDKEKVDRLKEGRRIEGEKKRELDGTTSPRSSRKENDSSSVDYVNINLDGNSAMAMANVKKFSLNTNGILSIEFMEGKGLAPNKSGTCSPQVWAVLTSSKSKEHEKQINPKLSNISKGKVQSKTIDPKWHDKLEFRCEHLNSQDNEKFLLVEVHDTEKKDEFMGQCKINLNNIADTIERQEWLDLRPRLGKKKDRAGGEILVKTKIMPELQVEPQIVLRHENFPAIPSFIYNSFWNSHLVTTVSVTHSAITSVPEGFANLASLTVLILSDNKLSSIPASLGKIYSLRRLDLDNNQLTKLPVTLGNLRNLKVLKISGNAFAEDGKRPGCIKTLEELGVCEIQGKMPHWDTAGDEVDNVGAIGSADEEERKQLEDKLKKMGMSEQEIATMIEAKFGPQPAAEAASEKTRKEKKAARASVENKQLTHEDQKSEKKKDEEVNDDDDDQRAKDEVEAAKVAAEAEARKDAEEAARQMAKEEQVRKEKELAEAKVKEEENAREKADLDAQLAEEEEKLRKEEEELRREEEEREKRRAERAEKEKKARELKELKLKEQQILEEQQRMLEEEEELLRQQEELIRKKKEEKERKRREELERELSLKQQKEREEEEERRRNESLQRGKAEEEIDNLIAELDEEDRKKEESDEEVDPDELVMQLLGELGEDN